MVSQATNAFAQAQCKIARQRCSISVGVQTHTRAAVSLRALTPAGTRSRSRLLTRAPEAVCHSQLRRQSVPAALPAFPGRRPGSQVRRQGQAAGARCARFETSRARCWLCGQGAGHRCSVRDRPQIKGLRAGLDLRDVLLVGSAATTARCTAPNCANAACRTCARGEEALGNRAQGQCAEQGTRAGVRQARG